MLQYVLQILRKLHRLFTRHLPWCIWMQGSDTRRWYCVRSPKNRGRSHIYFQSHVILVLILFSDTHFFLGSSNPGCLAVAWVRHRSTDIWIVCLSNSFPIYRTIITRDKIISNIMYSRGNAHFTPAVYIMLEKHSAYFREIRNTFFRRNKWKPRTRRRLL